MQRDNCKLQSSCSSFSCLQNILEGWEVMMPFASQPRLVSQDRFSPKLTKFSSHPGWGCAVPAMGRSNVG